MITWYKKNDQKSLNQSFISTPNGFFLTLAEDKIYISGRRIIHVLLKSVCVCKHEFQFHEEWVTIQLKTVRPSPISWLEPCHNNHGYVVAQGMGIRIYSFHFEQFHLNFDLDCQFHGSVRPDDDVYTDGVHRRIWSDSVRYFHSNFEDFRAKRVC